jgi:predicted AlkP superfamily pyrophosphatase or phosphodiesterase
MSQAVCASVFTLLFLIFIVLGVKCRRNREQFTPIDRVVLVVIDALRADFVLDVSSSSGNGRMEFVTQRLRDLTARAYVAHTQTPTVTMPRIKVCIFSVFVF